MTASSHHHNSVAFSFPLLASNQYENWSLGLWCHGEGVYATLEQIASGWCYNKNIYSCISEMGWPRVLYTFISFHHFLEVDLSAFSHCLKYYCCWNNNPWWLRVQILMEVLETTSGLQIYHLNSPSLLRPQSLLQLCFIFMLIVGFDFGFKNSSVLAEHKLFGVKDTKPGILPFLSHVSWYSLVTVWQLLTSPLFNPINN